MSGVVVLVPMVKKTKIKPSINPLRGIKFEEDPVDLDVWSPKFVEKVLKSAIQVLYYQSLGARDIPTGYKSNMPEYFRTESELADAEDDVSYRTVPSPRQFMQAEEAMPWIMKIQPVRNRKVFFMRLMGLKWEKIVERDGRSREHLTRAVYSNALSTISSILAKEEKIFPSGFTEITKFEY